MRQILVGVFLVTLAATAVPAQTPSPLDASIAHLNIPSHLPPCGMATAIDSIARQSGVLIGFERTSDCMGKFPRLDASVTDLSGMTVRVALDALMASAPGYRWLEMNGIAVIRPAMSWTDPRNALSMHVRPFKLDNATVRATLAILLNLPDVPVQNSRIDTQPYSVVFNGGTMVEALNALITAHGGVAWDAGLIAHREEDPFPTFAVTVRTPRAGERREGEGAVIMATPLPRLIAAR